MIAKSILNNTAFRSPLKSSSYLNPEGETGHKDINAPLMLTSLVDAFSILVIYLLMHFSSSGEFLVLSKNMELPKAYYGAELIRHTIVKVEEGKYYVESEEVAEDQLVKKLLQLSVNKKKLIMLYKKQTEKNSLKN